MNLTGWIKVRLGFCPPSGLTANWHSYVGTGRGKGRKPLTSKVNWKSALCFNQSATFLRDHQQAFSGSSLESCSHQFWRWFFTCIWNFRERKGLSCYVAGQPFHFTMKLISTEIRSPVPASQLALQPQAKVTQWLHSLVGTPITSPGEPFSSVLDLA